MRLITIAAALCILPLLLPAQRMGETPFKTLYLQAPSSTLATTYTTYSVQITGYTAALTNAGVTSKSLIDKCELLNYKKVPKGGHFNINLVLGRFSLTSSSTKKETTEKKGRDGKVKTITTYWKEVRYRLPVSMKVEDMEGNIISEEVIGTDEILYRFKNGKSNFSSISALNEAWKTKYTSLVNSFYRQNLNESTNALIKQFRKQYDYQIIEESSFLEFPKGKKVDNATEWELKAVSAANTLQGIKADEPLTQLLTELEGPISFWKNEKDNYDPTNKKEQKYYHAATFNLAVAHLLAEDYSQAEEYAIDCKTRVKWNTYRSEALLKRINQLKQLASDAPEGSLHFPLRDLSEATPPEGISYVQAVAAPKPTVYDSLAGYVLKENAKIEGVFLIPQNGSFRLRKSGGSRFYSTEGQRIDIHPDFVTEINYNGARYLSQELNDTGGGKRANFLQVIEDGPKMMLLRAVDFYGNSNSAGNHYLQKPGEKRVTLEFTNPRWLNWRGAFSKFFEDCPELYNAIKLGEYERKIRRIQDAIQFYNSEDCG